MSSTFERWHEEKQAAWIHRSLTRIERDPARARLFEEMSEAAESQAAVLAGDLKLEGHAHPAFAPTLRARLVVAIARRIGIENCKTMLAALKVRGLSVYGGRAQIEHGHPMPTSTSEIGARHARAGHGGTLRAAVFGVNDGLVSNTSLLLGLAGANLAPGTMLVTGMAGLLAGAFSMAAGEYVSMRSQRELYEFQIGEERAELERYPDEEAEELALIYAARGVPLDEARVMTKRMLQDPERALDVLAREELGLNPDDLGSPWSAAGSSFLAFALGAFLPLVPFFVKSLDHPVAIATSLAGVALFAVGAVLSLFSGRNALYGGARMLLIGALAGGATFGIGRLLGVSLS